MGKLSGHQSWITKILWISSNFFFFSNWKNGE